MDVSSPVVGHVVGAESVMVMNSAYLAVMDRKTVYSRLTDVASGMQGLSSTSRLPMTPLWFFPAS